MDAEVGYIASEFKVKDVGKVRQATFIVSHQCLYRLPSFPGSPPRFYLRGYEIKSGEGGYIANPF